MITINVVDAPCGYGKTTWAIEYMNMKDTGFHRFIFVTPFKDEVSRIRGKVTERTFYEPITDNKGITKLEDLHRLLGEGRDIATTHALFKMANDETRELIRVNNYTLILDEVIDVIQQIPLKRDDLRLLREAGVLDIYTNDQGLKFIRWIDEKKTWDTEYNNIKSLALSGNLMYCDNSAVIWNMPCEMFTLFHDVYILTYLFKGQLQKYYYDIHAINYRYLTVVKNELEYSLAPYSSRQIHDKSQLRNLISIYKGHLNKIGDKSTALSTSWFEKPANKDLIVSIQNNTYNFLTNHCKANLDTALWTTVKGNDNRIMKKVTPKGFKGAFISMTTRATNKYIERYHLAYLINRFMNPIEKKFFEQYGVTVDQEAWALSELVQWLWRSRIRKTIPEPINLYMPSSRMRGLLEKYLSSDVFEYPPENANIDELPSDWHIGF